MPREKISSRGEEYEVVYSEETWNLLREKREQAMKLMKCLQGLVDPIIHGSVARGDVHAKSDIDIVVLYPVYSYSIEILLESCGYKVYNRKIVMATPNHVPKAYIVLHPDELVQVSFPLARLRQREIEFYYFGGALSLTELEASKRVPGVNKRLELIIPTPRGHLAKNIIGMEEWVAKLLNISVETVLERVRVLTRRDNIGRTGVYLELDVPPDKSIEEVLIEESHKDPSIRKMLEERG